MQDTGVEFSPAPLHLMEFSRRKAGILLATKYPRLLIPIPIALNGDSYSIQF